MMNPRIVNFLQWNQLMEACALNLGCEGLGGSVPFLVCLNEPSPVAGLHVWTSICSGDVKSSLRRRDVQACSLCVALWYDSHQ